MRDARNPNAKYLAQVVDAFGVRAEPIRSALGETELEAVDALIAEIEAAE